MVTIPAWVRKVFLPADETRKFNGTIVVLALAAVTLLAVYQEAGKPDPTPETPQTAPPPPVVIEPPFTGAGYRLEDGQVVTPAGNPAGESESIVGWVDRIDVGDGTAFVHGWAADPLAGGPASAIVIFADAMAIGGGRPVIARPDVAEALELPQALYSGYAVQIRDLPGSDTTVRVFAVDSEGRAAELAYNSKLPIGNAAE